jgi:proline iminopeptidase
LSESFISVPGGRVWCSKTGDEAPGTALLCLHGGPGAPSDYLDGLRSLSLERAVILYDQLGCGRSERATSDEAYRPERFVEEVHAVREALELKRVHLLGHSWGGSLAVMYALAHPEGIQSLVLASPLINTERWIEDCNQLKAGLPDDIREVIEAHERRGFTGCFEYAAATLEWWRRHVCRLRPFPEEVERMLKGFGQECYEQMWGPSEFSCTGSLKELKLSSRLAELRVPTLFTCGRFDEATPESTRQFAELIPGSRLQLFERSSHMAHLEERELYLEHLRGFLREVESAS